MTPQITEALTTTGAPTQEMLHALMRATPLAIIVVNTEGQVTIWNQGAERMFGWTAAEAIGKDIPFIPLGKESESQAIRAATLRGETFSDLELRRQKKNGEPIDVLLSNAPLLNQQGAICGIVSVLADITDRVRAEAQLRLHGMALQAAANGVVLTDRHGTVLWVNTAFTSLTGFTYDEVVGHKTNLLRSGHHSDSFYTNLWERILAGEIWQGEMINRRKDGALYTEEQTITPVRDENGQVSHFIAIKQDVTQRKLFEQVLRESEEQYRSLVEAAQDAIFTLTPAGRIASLNSAFETLTGWPRDAWLDEPFTPLVDAQSLPVAEAMLARVQKGERPPVFELEIISRTGKLLTAQISATPQIRDGQVVGILGIARDMTDRRHAESAMQESERRLRDLYDNSPDAIFVEDLHGNILDVNQAACRLHGLRREQLVGANAIDLVPPEHRETALREFAKLASADLSHAEGYSLRGDGVSVPVELATSQIQYNGQPALLLHVRDITERKLAEAHIQQKSSELGAVLRALPDTFLRLEADGKILDAHASNQCQLPSPTAELTGKCIAEVFSPPIAQRWHQSIEEVGRTKELVTLEYACGTVADEELFEARLSALPNGQVVALIRNITERKHTEMTLREGEQRYRAVVEQSADGIYMVDSASKKVVESNAAFRRMLGFAPEETFDLTIYDFVVDERSNIDARLAELTVDHQPINTERRYRRRDGTFLIVSVTASVISYSGRNLVCTLVRDITERKRTEQALQESEELFRSLSGCSPLGIFLTDVHGRCIYSNPQCRAIFNTSLMESLGEGWMRCVHPDDHERVHHEWEATVREGREHSSEFRLQGPDGKLIWVHLRSSRMVSDKGDLRGNVATVENITERKQAEQSLMETNRRLETVLEQLKATQAQVVQQERLSALGTMASGIAHDFNNALAAILGFSELLLHRPELLDDREKTRRYLSMMNTAAKDAGTVVSRLREFYRHREEGEVFAAVDLRHLVEQAVSLTQPHWQAQAQANGITVKVQTELQTVPPVAGNSAELREALTNLIINAVDAMPQGGVLTLRTYVDDGQSLITIADTGTGMTEEVRQHCFEPFFSTKGTRGTGLGLAMVYGIIHRHRGDIHIESAVGKGTTFIIRLPQADPRPEAEEAGPEAVLHGALRILLIDDEEMVRNVLADLLHSEGHAVQVASDGRDGLAKFHKGQYDVVFVDRAMPGMSGDQVAASIKSIKQAMPVILLTGFGSLMNSAGEKPDGVDFVVAKPATIADLRAALVRALGIRHSQQPAPAAT